MNNDILDGSEYYFSKRYRLLSRTLENGDWEFLRTCVALRIKSHKTNREVIFYRDHDFALSPEWGSPLVFDCREEDLIPLKLFLYNSNIETWPSEVGVLPRFSK